MDIDSLLQAFSMPFPNRHLALVPSSLLRTLSVLCWVKRPAKRPAKVGTSCWAQKTNLLDLQQVGPNHPRSLQVGLSIASWSLLLWSVFIPNSSGVRCSVRLQKWLRSHRYGLFIHDIIIYIYIYNANNIGYKHIIHQIQTTI